MGGLFLPIDEILGYADLFLVDSFLSMSESSHKNTECPTGTVNVKLEYEDHPMEETMKSYAYTHTSQR